MIKRVLLLKMEVQVIRFGHINFSNVGYDELRKI
jgi:hypothetical protein